MDKYEERVDMIRGSKGEAFKILLGKIRHRV
jgi:hypothetical protein